MPTVNKTYSFQDVQAVVAGPGGTAYLTQGGVANEGISIESNERITTLFGADGEWMHSLHAAKGGRCMIRLLRTGEANAALGAMYNFDMQSSANSGQNIITIHNFARGDNWTITGAAFQKLPNNSYGTEGGTLEWTFLCGTIDGVFGDGTPGTTA